MCSGFDSVYLKRMMNITLKTWREKIWSLVIDE